MRIHQELPTPEDLGRAIDELRADVDGGFFDLFEGEDVPPELGLRFALHPDDIVVE